MIKYEMSTIIVGKKVNKTNPIINSANITTNKANNHFTTLEFICSHQIVF